MDDPDVHACYAEGWLDRGGLRVNFVASVDGAATVEGLSRGLQTHGDNRVFAVLRDLADVVLVGAGTVREERYGALHQSDRRHVIREAYGFAPTLPLAVVSRSLRLDPDAALFTKADARTIVITCESSAPPARELLAERADLIVTGGPEVDLRAALDALRDRGHRRVLSEGGPTLFANLADAGLVDEVCLSVTPMLAGPEAQRIVDGVPWAHPPVRLRLGGLLEEDGALFCRYVR